MFKIALSRFSCVPRCSFSDSIKRYFLSNAYKCEEVWASRLKNPVLQKADPGNLFHDLDTSFQKKTHVSVLDVDLLITGINDPSFRNEVEDVLLRIRMAPECGVLPERTTHAAIRWYLKYGEKEDLLNVLSDRINFGLFPDYYLNNYMMDKYLKEKDAVTAVKIAVLQMLQEDLEHPIMKVLALHCCYSYLESPEVWPSYKEPEPDPDEDVQKVRVQYLRNPYFDDHFDITDTNHLVGKTLWLFGRSVDGTMGTSSQLVGLVLYEKYKQCAEFLENVIKDNKKVHADAVDKAKQYILKKPKQIEEATSEDVKADGKEETKPDVETKPEVEAEPLDEFKNKVLALLEKIPKGNLEKGSLLTVSSELVKKRVSENEEKDIKHQCEVYKKWNEEREQHIQAEINEARLDRIKSEIQKTKEQLEKEEERLFFFDNEEELKKLAEKQEMEKNTMVFYKGKGKHKEKIHDDYIPPEVGKKS